MTFARDLANFADVSANNTTFRNLIINGAINVWQRGTSFTTDNAYSADRWLAYRGTTGFTVSRQSSGLTGFEYCARVQRNSGNTSTSPITLQYSAESVDSIRFAGKTIVLSFYARAGSNYSSASSYMSAAVRSGTGTDQRIASGFTGDTTVAGSDVFVLTTSWQRFSISGTAGSSITQLGLRFAFTPVGTASTNDYFEITGVQLEVGSSASAFENRPVGTEFALCQRYYEKSFPYSTAPQNGPNSTSFVTTDGLLGYVSGNSMQVGFLKFTVQKRIAPTMTAYGNSTGQTKYRDSITSSTDVWSVSALQFSGISDSGVLLQQNVVNNVVVPVQGHWVADAEL